MLGGLSSSSPKANKRTSDELAGASAAGPITAIATGGWNRDFVVTASAGDVK